ncbi:molybdopterin-dependent oxidoreductase [Methanobrevibacter sp.]|uniref:molybdopterin-dependent oxidoreductase n=1 Tax=Methanobrevibacter sp. TaxID=66852 RepID=UPI003869FA71
MLEIKHTLCPSCSVGCGINVVLKEGEVVGSFPYKRHPINEGKNCANGRDSIENYKNKIKTATISNSETDIDKAIGEVLKELSSADASTVTVICSGNNTVEETEAIKNFAESKNYNIGFFADNLCNIEDVASYDDIENAKTILVIGDVLYDNPLIGRRIVHAKQNGAKICANGLEKSVTENISDEYSTDSVQEFLDAAKSNLYESDLIIFNKVDSPDDFDRIISIVEDSKCKVLPVYSKSNTKGTLNFMESKSEEDMIELLDNTKVLLVFNDDIADEIDFDFSRISKIISFAYCENNTTKISDIVIPIKAWLEKDGSFINAMGETQSFKAVAESDTLSEIEVIEKLNG